MGCRLYRPAGTVGSGDWGLRLTALGLFPSLGRGPQASSMALEAGGGLGFRKPNSLAEGGISPGRAGKGGGVPPGRLGGHFSFAAREVPKFPPLIFFFFIPFPLFLPLSPARFPGAIWV